MTLSTLQSKLDNALLQESISLDTYEELELTWKLLRDGLPKDLENAFSDRLALLKSKVELEDEDADTEIFNLLELGGDES